VVPRVATIRFGVVGIKGKWFQVLATLADRLQGALDRLVVEVSLDIEKE